MFIPNVYTYSRAVTNPTAVTQLQIATATTKPILILRAWVSANNTASPASAGVAVQLNRKSAAATVTAAVIANDVAKHNPSDSASTLQVGTALTGYTASAEGTDTDLLYRDAYNVLNGWLYLPVPEEREVVPASGFIGLKFLLAPPAGTYYIGICFCEIG